MKAVRRSCSLLQCYYYTVSVSARILSKTLLGHAVLGATQKSLSNVENYQHKMVPQPLFNVG